MPILWWTNDCTEHQLVKCWQLWIAEHLYSEHGRDDLELSPHVKNRFCSYWFTILCVCENIQWFSAFQWWRHAATIHETWNALNVPSYHACAHTRTHIRTHMHATVIAPLGQHFCLPRLMCVVQRFAFQNFTTKFSKFFGP